MIDYRRVADILYFCSKWLFAVRKVNDRLFTAAPSKDVSPETSTTRNMNKATRTLLVFLLIAGSLQAQRTDKSRFWKAAADTLLRAAITRLPSATPDNCIDSLSSLMIARLTQHNLPEENLANIIIIAGKLGHDHRFELEESILNKAIYAARQEGDTLNYPFSQLFACQATMLRDQMRMKEALHLTMHEISILKSLDTLHPALLDAYTNLMTNYFALRQTEPGLRIASKILALARSTGYPYYEINTYRLMGDILKFYQPPLGLECMRFADWLNRRKVSEGFADDPYYSISMGSAWVASDQPDSALRWFKHGLELTRRLPDEQNQPKGYLYYYTGVCYKNMLIYDKAVEYIDSALNFDLTMKTVNGAGYYRLLHMKGKMLNQLGRFDTALVINREVLRNTPGDIASYYANAVEQYSRSLLGSNRPEEALALVHRQICRMTSCPDTTEVLLIPDYSHQATPQTELRELSFIIGLKNEILVALYQKTKQAEYLDAIIGNMRYLLTMIDLEAGVAQTPDGLADLARRYRLFADQLVDFFAGQPATDNDSLLRKIYPLIARSQSYSVICRSYALGSAGNSSFDEGTMRLNRIYETLLSLNPATHPDAYRRLKEEEIGLLTNRYLQSIDKGEISAQLLVPQMLLSEDTRPEQGIEPGEVLYDFYTTARFIVRFTITSGKFKVLFQPLPADFDAMCSTLAGAVKSGDTEQTKRAAKQLGALLFYREKDLKNKKRITIIPDEKLYYIPFELLSFPGSRKMLTENHRIAYRYTSHLYKLPSNKPLLGPLVAFAPMSDTGITTLASTCVRSNEIDNLSILNREAGSFAALPYSLAEVVEVAGLFNKQGIRATVYAGSEAGKSTFKQTLGGATIVHIATHGLVNSTNPEKSGLMFAADSTGKSDAMLYMGEMYSLKANPSLIVLSACKTGVGKLERGDGIMALPRGLLVAGAQNVVASLWNVNDLATKQLMVLFYRNILNGEDYPTALQKSKMECRAKGILPIDWAGFILIER
ncbi:MAG: hypothetical protein A2X11_09550 [Bacteroidetes bacterium GWE2_42_24]|nr:MAG: hypothetical protein A2X11_09550 [Bacteroidetes bacterium GWE2_42_24]OFY25749.1 MAG: hypothetical protein A2X09_09205 [Bacteroidetes bacterium GWF2_43_11]